MRSSESFSIGRFRSTSRGSTPFDEGLICAASAADASRGEMDMATSCAVAPLGNSFSEPSGNLILMVSGMNAVGGTHRGPRLCSSESLSLEEPENVVKPATWRYYFVAL